MALSPKEIRDKGQALDKLLSTLQAKVAASTPAPIVIPEAGEKLLMVKVWQQVSYLVRCRPDQVKDKMTDPLERIAKVGEGEISTGSILEIRDATMEDLDAAIPTKALVI